MHIGLFGTGMLKMRSSFVLQIISCAYLVVDCNAERGCGGTLYARESLQTVTSPGYPYVYRENMDCTWILEAPTGFWIWLKINHINIEEETACVYDALMIFYSEDTSELNKLLGKFCGFSRNIEPLISLGNRVAMKFTTDATLSREGFSLGYKRVQNICGGELSLVNSSRVITSPNYPHYYPHNVDCVWVIIAPDHERIQMDFIGEFEIEHHSECAYDFVAMHDGGTETSPPLGRFCGNSKPATLVSTGNVIRVRFRTDSDVSKIGFKARYTIDVDECASNPCQNGGQCTDGQNMFTCSCTNGWTGTTCQIDVDECASNPCQNGGQCTDGQNMFTCSCTNGWTGTTCQIETQRPETSRSGAAPAIWNVDECASNPCQNGGQCTDGQNMFTCSCTNGWTGTTCQIGFVCNPDNTIDVSNLPANYSYFAMQNVSAGPDVECNVTVTSTTSVRISACSKDLDILLTYSTYKEMSTYGLHGGKSLTALVVKCSEIPDNGTVHKVNYTFESNLILSSLTAIDVTPTYSVDSFLSTNFTTVGSDVTWTITFPEEYTLEVTSCTAYPGADDSSPDSVSLISDGGCSVTDDLISNFTDHGNGSVTATILAFKFYRNDYVFLQCGLKVCPKYSIACNTQCSRMKRSVYKRNVNDRVARDSSYTDKVKTVLRVIVPVTFSGAMRVVPVNPCISSAFNILLLLFVTEM